MQILSNRLNKFAAAVAGSLLAVGCTAQSQADLSDVLNHGSHAFNVHFIVLADTANFPDTSTEMQMRREVNILNQYFVSAQQEKLVRFVYKSTVWSSDIGSNCQALKDLGNAPVEYGNGSAWEEAINGCLDPDIVDPMAINFIVYDAWDADEQFMAKSSHGRVNSNHPYVLIDYQRLNHMTQSPEEHEMGHAFGLNHICVPGATNETSTNIMVSTNGCDNGKGGKRDIGFNPGQVRRILNHAQLFRCEFADPGQRVTFGCN